MRYGIIINLDYISHPKDPVKHTFLEIEKALEEEGFIRDGRLFIINSSAADAQRRARRAVEAVETLHAAQGESVYPYIKEFFGFELRHAANLLLPPTDDISVIELADLEGVEGVEVIELRGYE